MYKDTSFIMTGTIFSYNMNVANAQNTNMTKSTAGPNMTKTMNMTAGMGNTTKSTHHSKSEITRTPGM
jgi:hypothetical protein